MDVIQSPVAGLFLVFEYVAFDLKTYMDRNQTSTEIQKRKGLPAAVVKDFMRQILAGVGFIHSFRVLHRDLKPHNVSYNFTRTNNKIIKLISCLIRSVYKIKSF